MNDAYLRIIQSNRVSERTRQVFLQRVSRQTSVYLARSLSQESFAVLQAVIGRLIPQRETDDHVEIAQAMDQQNNGRDGDGWRYATMPPDHIAMGLGLQLLQRCALEKHGVAFPRLQGLLQDSLLAGLQQGRICWEELEAQKWFEEILVQATEIYVSHPTILAAIGFSGIAFLPRWKEIGLDSAQSWEPVEK